MIRIQILLASIIIALFTPFITQSDIPDWIINDTEVYFEDDLVFISSSPHTLKSSDWIETRLISKQYTGNIDFVFGFDTSQIKPLKSQLYSPHNVSHEYTCEHEFTYTQNPNYFWCYETLQDGNGTFYNVTHFEHSFDTGNIPSRTAYWKEEVEWKDWNPTTKVNHEAMGMNTWFYAKNQPITANKEYKIRYYLNIPSNSKGKYLIAIKPSHETIQQAINNNHLYMLDPWWDTDPNYLLNDLVIYYTFDDWLDDSRNFKNASCTSCPTFNSSGKVGDAINFSSSNKEYVSIDTGANLFDVSINWSVAFWINCNQTNAGVNPGVMGFDNSSDIKVNLGNDADIGKMQMLITDGATTITTGRSANLADNNWHFFVFVYNASTKSIAGYVDNVHWGTGTNGALTDYNGSNSDLFIGHISNLATSVNGSIDEWGLWHKSLNETDMNALYNESNGFGYSHMDDGSKFYINTNGTTPTTPLLGVVTNIWVEIYNVSTNEEIQLANFTLESPNETIFINGVNGTASAQVSELQNWTSSSFLTDWHGAWDWSVLVIGNKSGNLSASGTFNVSDINESNMTLHTPTGTYESSLPATIPINITMADESGIKKCKYEVAIGDYTSNTTMNVIFGNTTINFSSTANYSAGTAGIYNINIHCNDSADNQANISGQFTVTEPSSGDGDTGGGGGGGAGTPIVCGEEGDELFWTAKTTRGGNKYDYFIAPDGKETRRIELENGGKKNVTIKLSCGRQVDEGEDFCQFVEIEPKEITLTTAQIETVDVTVTLNNEFQPDFTNTIEKAFNIYVKDNQASGCTGVVNFKAKINIIRGTLEKASFFEGALAFLLIPLSAIFVATRKFFKKGTGNLLIGILTAGIGLIIFWLYLFLTA